MLPVQPVSRVVSTWRTEHEQAQEMAGDREASDCSGRDAAERESVGALPPRGDQTTQYYGWKKRLLALARMFFDAAANKRPRRQKAETKLGRMKDVSAEIIPENLVLKRASGFRGLWAHSTVAAERMLNNWYLPLEE